MYGLYKSLDFICIRWNISFFACCGVTSLNWTKSKTRQRARSRGVTRAVFYPFIWLANIKTKGSTSRKSFFRSGSQTLIFGGREATTGNTSAVRRLICSWLVASRLLSFIGGHGTIGRGRLSRHLGKGDDDKDRGKRRRRRLHASSTRIPR